MTNFTLSDTTPVDQKYVYKTGLIFRAGDYTDKKFTMSPEELLEAEARFKPVPLDVEHINDLGILDGKLGRLEAVKASADGQELYGTAKIPAWLNDLHGDNAFKVSCTWARDTKSLEKLALVKNPRVSDAALMAAFSENELKDDSVDIKEVVQSFFTWFAKTNTESSMTKTWDGKWTIQSIHDSASRSGAICTKDDKDGKTDMSKNADFISSDEAKVLQKIHDLAVEYGAKCSFYEDVNYTNTDNGENKTMSTWESIKGFFADIPADVKSAEDVKKFADGRDEAEALKNQIESLKTELEQFKQTKVEDKVVEPVIDPVVEALKAELSETKLKIQQAEASTFAETLITEGKILPAQKAVVEAMFAQAIKDDADQNIKVTFDNVEVTSRTEMLKILFSTQESNKLTKEVLGNSTIVNLSDTDRVNIQDLAKKQAEAYASKRNAEMGRKA
jgi:hypothetical protein